MMECIEFEYLHLREEKLQDFGRCYRCGYPWLAVGSSGKHLECCERIFKPFKWYLMHFVDLRKASMKKEWEKKITSKEWQNKNKSEKTGSNVNDSKSLDVKNHAAIRSELTRWKLLKRKRVETKPREKYTQ